MADRMSMDEQLREALAKIKPEHQIPMPSEFEYQKQLVDAMMYGQSAARTHRIEKTLQDFPDHELIMEMIRRGYAAMKLPKDGGPPEVLK